MSHRSVHFPAWKSAIASLAILAFEHTHTLKYSTATEGYSTRMAFHQLKTLAIMPP
ncbi:MAG: hypothetical protein HY318_03945 [Armatimonadetes bacterium]|nr:hypothetical protein [Armatimonadota bacterium]